jgi:hypothetical protein
MAAIPMGVFDQVQGPAPVQTGSPDLSGTLAKSRAGVELGMQAQQIGLQGMQHQVDQGAEEARALATATAAGQHTAHELQTRAIADDTITRTQAGDLAPDKAAADYDAQVAKLPSPPPIPNLTPAIKESLKLGLVNNVTASRLQVVNGAKAAGRTQLATQLDTNLQLLVDKAGLPGADVAMVDRSIQALRPLFAAGGIDGPHAEQLLHNAHVKIWDNVVGMKTLALSNDAEGLKQQYQDLTEPDGAYIDKLPEDRRLAQATAVQTKMTQLENATTQAANKRETLGKQAASAAWEQAGSGLAPLPADASLWVSNATGTAAEPELKQAFTAIAEVQKLHGLSPMQMDTAVQAKEAGLAAGGTVHDKRMLEVEKSAVEAWKKQIIDQPVIYQEAYTGRPAATIDFQKIQAGDTSEFARVLTARRVDLDAMRTQLGPTVGRSLLKPQEKDLLAKVIDVMPPEKLTGLFNTLYKGAKDPVAYEDVMQQIAPDSPVKTYAGIIAGRQQKALEESSGQFSRMKQIESGDVAYTILQGDAVIDKGKTAASKDGTPGRVAGLPKDKDFGDAFNLAVGNAFAGRPSELEVARQAVKAYYVGRALQQGVTSDELDPGRMSQAVRAVVGDVATFGDSTVVPPWGMDHSTFDNQAKLAINARLAAAGIHDEGGVSLQNVPGNRDGLYKLIRNGNYVADKHGTPMGVRVLFSAPVRHVAEPKALPPGSHPDLLPGMPMQRRY